MVEKITYSRIGDYNIPNLYIPKDTRICQFRIIKHQPKIEFKEVSQLNSFNRGGFGSTGIN